MRKTIHIGHSPDPDDAFMFYALKKREVQCNGFKVQHVIEDIQSLNQRALKAELEVTAISAAVYPLVSRDYWILSCGASVGRNYGPIVVSEKRFSKKELMKKRIAVPGMHTTAFLLLKIFLEHFIPVETNFTDIIPAVKQKKVDAGLIIHEDQINFRTAGLYKCLDLGAVWHRKYSLPIPLGLDVVRKDVGIELAQQINQSLFKSILFAKKNEEKALDYALDFARGISRKLTKKFVRMYVNNDTLSLSGDSQKALKKLFENGVRLGLFNSVPKIEVIS